VSGAGSTTADDLTTGCAGGSADANAKPFGVLVFAGVGFVAVGGMQEKPSAPHSRLAYIHLQASSLRNIGTPKTE
jgi:hypothetical protein